MVEPEFAEADAVTAERVEGTVVDPNLALIEGGNEWRLSPGFVDGFDRSPVPAPWSAQDAQPLQLAATLQALYDTNVRHSSVVPPGGTRGDLTASLRSALRWRNNQASDWHAAASLSLGYDAYLQNSDLSGLGYDLNGRLAYDGGNWSAALSAGAGLERGGNNFSGRFIEQQSLFARLNTVYELSAKTRLNADFASRWVIPDVENASETQHFDVRTAALWRYSKLLEIGPGLHYQLDTGENHPERHAFGPMLRANYRFSSKVRFHADAGVDYSQVEAGDAGFLFQTRTGVDYRPSPLWAAQLDLVKSSVADSTAPGAHRDLWTLRGRVQRKVRRATWWAGAEYNDVSYDLGSTTLTTDPDFTVWGIDTGVGFPVWRDILNGATYLRLVSRQGSAGTSWDSFQWGVALTAQY
jgi:hypothetical protein